MASTQRFVPRTTHEHLILRILFTSLLLLAVAVGVGYAFGWLLTQGVLDALAHLKTG